MYSQTEEFCSTKRSHEDTSDDSDKKETLEKYTELVCHLSAARDELVKFQSRLNLFTPWMEKSQSLMRKKEKNLSKRKKLDRTFESTQSFVSDVIAHKEDLNLITNSATNFINQVRKYKEFSKTFRTTLPPKKQARIDSLCRMEGELKDTVTSIGSRYRKLLSRVQSLLTSEIDGLTNKQSECKEATGAAAAWLEGAERRFVEISDAPVPVDINGLEDQLSRITVFRNEFVSKRDLIDHAQQVLKMLLKSLEGQLSPEEISENENPIKKIDRKYNRLLKTLDEKLTTLHNNLADLQPQQSNGLVTRVENKSEKRNGESKNKSISLKSTSKKYDASSKTSTNERNMIISSKKMDDESNQSKSKHLQPQKSNDLITRVENKSEKRNNESKNKSISLKSTSKKHDVSSKTPKNEHNVVIPSNKTDEKSNQSSATIKSTTSDQSESQSLDNEPHIKEVRRQLYMNSITLNSFLDTNEVLLSKHTHPRTKEDVIKLTTETQVILEEMNKSRITADGLKTGINLVMEEKPYLYREDFLFRDNLYRIYVRFYKLFDMCRNRVPYLNTLMDLPSEPPSSCEVANQPAIDYDAFDIGPEEAAY